MESIILETNDLSRSFGGVMAVDGVTLRQSAGEILGVIGPNGAGKSTLVNLLTAVYRPSAGSIRFNGVTFHRRLSSHQVARLGIARTFQTPQIFDSLTVLDNVITAIAVRKPWWKPTLNLHDQATKWLEFMGILHLAGRIAGNLAYGQRRLLEIARALAVEPLLLLLDEPGAGMNPTELDELLYRLESIRGQNIAILLIEHNMRLVMRVSDRVLVLVSGRKEFEGLPKDAMSDANVVEHYLGKRAQSWEK